MDSMVLDKKISDRGKEFFASISGEAPSIFNKGWWTGKVMDWSMKNENFKVQLFRFVDVLPYLNTSDSLTRHIDEYFAGDDQDVPKVLKWGAGAMGSGLGGKLAAGLMAKTIRSNIEGMAKQFIIGENTSDAMKNLKKIRKDGFAFTVDILGEASVSEIESEAYLNEYIELLDALKKEHASWAALGGGELDWGHAPKVNISVKPTALFSQASPKDFEGSVRGIENRLATILRKVKEMNGFMRIDMEQYKFKDITLEVYRRLRSSEEFRDYPHLGIVLQAYLKDTDKDLADLLAWSRAQGLPISIRLVKGAYWDSETVIAKQNGWDIPVWTIKAESDAAYERQAKVILENHDICHFGCASHNIRTIAAVMETAKALNVPDERYEFQVLYGMAEPVRKGLMKVAKRVRLYAPYGDLLPGMAYLVRRLLENTANESFLRQSFAEEAEVERLMENPVATVEREKAQRRPGADPEIKGLTRFENEPFADFTQEAVRRAFVDALAVVRTQLGKEYPLVIGGQEVRTADTLQSVNPANPNEVIGTICQASTKEIDLAIEAAKKAAPAWKALSPEERAGYLLKAAEIARTEIFTLCAWQTLEVGKQYDQAQADVAEAIDFMEYYAREMIRFGKPQRMGRAPGEMSQLMYQPKGIAAVIAPWNFPLAISCGMSSAAIVAGNPVLYKPAGPSSVVGFTLSEIFRKAGLPAGVFNYVPGRGSVMGDYLVEHPDVALIAFTGSMEVGHRIINKASVVHPGQKQIKKVIAELGGKNAIIIDDDADLDEAIREVLHSAFAFQGQKCSACSRVIVVEPIYAKFIERLVEGAKSLAIGPAEDPTYFMGPVVDDKAQQNVLKYIGIATSEGKLLYSSPVPDSGYYAPLTIVEGITPEHRIAQEEVFGPVLAVMKVKNFDQAIEWANSTRYSLTGAVFSRSPKHLEKAREQFNVGNLYLNRGSTGALVERHPFGGFNMSGIGSKAGGPDYLLQFMDPRLVCENTMRRGFAPIEEDDDWII
ncbi:RHH-type transcriptional regulator, proline utilization regulon repressor / proline dehydrogenase / delta 1-pyrroline-5-carboxylate dehydrogenase [Desulfomicrobium norvegicum]|uniref:L-glutamate gamma-semialdehyde dehydrogenase n=1 Tax=Desulfomicrobium norvegicum (strain DSM 1741 / NCIMB 8310) TaxID=52561 RepID=A0A8G2C164_DESNO|nr:L-glutamate gamma-semialdehyde dehydrogenase [Desulfomicrobium norvegicum]SFL45649.1 RHH-type transcriptional regulator, proline utilization regulon repressor / proline dehydrogenase / delta 1-pyrroline-5-carboxylate dehydrogenase [Desulfomicrobium norvegicum]